ncbi:hypothetical protein PMIT1327_01500 [Prochlorococcus marinus str. MIT 1327]|nr:hypothetical protein PMIT1312_01931 [Prochlorococcus marinus str. MIT 1312]KZR81051.1 hypothetical protein PMIT1327_01500 [Prochlorococcus marinus str. MIT 1327]
MGRIDFGVTSQVIIADLTFKKLVCLKISGLKYHTECSWFFKQLSPNYAPLSNTHPTQKSNF